MRIFTDRAHTGDLLYIFRYAHTCIHTAAIYTRYEGIHTTCTHRRSTLDIKVCTYSGTVDLHKTLCKSQTGILTET